MFKIYEPEDITIQDIEKQYDNMWRLWNGERFVYGFQSKFDAIEKGIKFGAEKIGYAKLNQETGNLEYSNVMFL